MPQPTHQEVQQVNPVLSNLLVGYRQADERFIAGRVFPSVPVDLQGFTFYKFTKKYWFTDQMVARAAGGEFARSGYGIETDSGLAKLWGLEHKIPDEVRANNQTPMGLEQAGTMWLAQQSLIRRERAWAEAFMKTGVWATDDNNSTDDWDDPTNGDPFDDVMTAKRTISTNTGVMANTMVLGEIVHQALVNHPDIVDRVKYTKDGLPGTVEGILAMAFGVSNYLVSRASYNSANEGQPMVASPIIDDDCLITYVSPTPGIFTPSAGYTFVWAGGGGDGQIITYREQKTKSDVLQNSEAWEQKAVATDVGYFFADVV